MSELKPERIKWWAENDDYKLEQSSMAQQILRQQAEIAGLREAAAWAYQAIGALQPTREALDNLSAVLEHKRPPHEWPIVTDEFSRLPQPTFCKNCGHVAMKGEADASK